MNINGAHVIVYSQDAEADRAFFRDVLQWPHVDVGHGWLIFALPRSEVAVHPTMSPESPGSHELYLMCEDVQAVVARMRELDVPCGEVEEAGWGSIVSVTLPGGSELGIYEPKHARPPEG